MTLSALDEYDIHRSFEAMDDDKINRISIESFHTIYLALGFQPKQLSVQDLQSQVAAVVGQSDGSLENDDGLVSLPVVLEILSRHTREDRTRGLEKGFQSISAGKGYISAQDLQRLSEELGEPISENEAKLMVGVEQLQKAGFTNIFSPPSP